MQDDETLYEQYVSAMEEKISGETGWLLPVKRICKPDAQLC
jgi:hypothetical protein